MVPWVSALPQRRSSGFQESGGRRGGKGVSWERWRGGLTLHLLGEAVHIIGLIGVSDAIGSHTGELVFVPIAAFPWNVDGIPARNTKWKLGP